MSSSDPREGDHVTDHTSRGWIETIDRPLVNPTTGETAHVAGSTIRVKEDGKLST